MADINPDYLKQFAAADNPSKFLGLGFNVGAQQMQGVQGQMKSIQTAIDQQWQDATAKLKAINPAFDPQNYFLDTSKVYDPGEGASSNREAVVDLPQKLLQSQLRAIQKAQDAAQKYQQTGQIDPFPTPQQLAAEAFPYDAGNQKAIENIVNRAAGKVSPEQQASANAAAARVGVALPYPTAKIGDIVGGGLFQSAADAQKYYQNGQLTQQGQNILNSASSKNIPAGTQASTAQGGSSQGGYSQGAQDLVKQILQQGGNLENLQSNPLWSQSPNKQEAYQLLQNVFSSPQNLASYVQGQGFNDLQNLSWWSGYPQKQQAYQLIQQAQQTGQPITGSTLNLSGTQGTQGVQPGGTPQNPTGTGQGTSQDNLLNPDPKRQAALDIINKSGLDAGTKLLFSNIVNNWDPASGYDPTKMISAFQDIKSNTIDPYFQELSDTFIKQATNSVNNMQQQRGLQLEQEKTQTKENIRGTQADLESRGMTYSGEATRQLGNQSAYKQPGAETSPGQVPINFGQQEGLVPQANRLMASSSAANYQQNLDSVAQQLESQLGSSAAGGIIPGGQLLGTVKESAQLPSQKSQAEASTLQNLYSQEQTNIAGQKPIQPFQT